MKRTGMMMVVIVAGAMVLPVVAFAGSCCGGPAKAAKVVAQTTCPIMGGKINKAIFTEQEGKRIYVCCKGCIGKIEKEPAKYIKQLEDAGVTLEKVQTKCPVMGGKINKKQYVDHDGKRIYVCCPGCIGKIKAEPAKYMKKLADAGVVLAAVPKEKTEKKKDGHGGHD